ncbi:unnamed protein product [Periconia digitata]|uniref:SCP domain-containing protein n=1 Tax=Periconia digitata TaxID=1303443 RepID=A0A9W4U6W8_9PLEO|nr:unnamed protein product [Periconia digitata]
MRSVSIISALALVGSTLAAPVAEPKLVIVTQTAVTTVTQGAAPTQAVEKVEANYRPEGQGNRRPDPVTIIRTIKYGGGPQTTQQPAQPTYAPAPPPPAPSSEPPKVTYAPAPPPPAPSSKAPEPTYAAPAPSTGGSGSYIDIVNKWRAKIDRAPLELDPKLEGNAQVTCNEGDGAMKHKIEKGSGTGGQVLAPVAPGADPTDFEKVFVGGWLCEVSSDPGLGSEVCDKLSKGYNLAGQRGHYDILKSDKYTKIGCGFYKDIWGCDLGS